MYTALKSLMATLIAIIVALGISMPAYATECPEPPTNTPPVLANGFDPYIERASDSDLTTYSGPIYAGGYMEAYWVSSTRFEGVEFAAYSACSSNTLTLTLSYYDGGSWVEVSSGAAFTVSDGDTVSFDLTGSPVTTSQWRLSFDAYSCEVGVYEIYGLYTDCDEDGIEDTDVGGTDCDDATATTYPGAADTCDGTDSDCDGTVEQDGDSDGSLSCEDCDDADAAAYPGGTETADGVDNDCDGTIDEGTSVFDDDGDGYTEADGDCDDADSAVSPGATEVVYDGVDNDCDESSRDDDLDEDGYSSDQDCNDSDPVINPGAAEACNGADDNCDGSIDEGFADTNGNGTLDCQETDDDGDGYAEFEGDCNDGDDSINPGEAEACDFIDQDCDGEIDEGLDTDGDGYTDCAGDCEEGDASVFPGAEEVCDEQDNNCNGQSDEGFDVDADGFTTCGEVDCNDSDAAINPEAEEVCGDTVDQDCDGEDLTCPDTGDGDDTAEVDGEPVLEDPVLAGGGGCRCSGVGSSLLGPGGWQWLVIVGLMLLVRHRRYVNGQVRGVL